jgi:hypothetical protein
VARPLAAELAQDPVHLSYAALRPPEDDALAVGVHGVLPHRTVEHAAAVLAEPERPLLLAVDLWGRGRESDEEIWGSVGAGSGRTARSGGGGPERTWTALWKMPPRPMRSLKMRLIWRMVLFVLSESLFVTSYTWSTTSCIAAPLPAPGTAPPPAAEGRLGLGRRERDGRGEESEASARGVGWLGGWLLAVAGDGDAVVVPPNTSRVLWSLSVLYSVKEHWRVGPDQQVGAITISSYVFGIVGGFVTVRHREAPREEVMGEITLRR